jgi:uncharacterized protein (DUF1697 family)
MQELRRLLEAQGCRDVRTYIQSGNVVFRGTAGGPRRLAARIAEAVSRAHGFAPHVLVLSREALARAAAGNPFPEAEDSPTHLHLFFLDGRPTRPDLEGLESLTARGERFALKGAVLYLHAPAGIGRSKLAAQAERRLGVEATARNWRTVTALLEMATQ